MKSLGAACCNGRGIVKSAEWWKERTIADLTLFHFIRSLDEGWSTLKKLTIVYLGNISWIIDYMDQEKSNE